MTSPASLQQGARALRGARARMPVSRIVWISCAWMWNPTQWGRTSREQQIRTTTARAPQPNPHHDRVIQQAAGLVQGLVLEGGDGADARRPAVLGKNHIRQRDCGNEAFPASRFITGLGRVTGRVTDAALPITARSDTTSAQCVRFSVVRADMMMCQTQCNRCSIIRLNIEHTAVQ